MIATAADGCKRLLAGPSPQPPERRCSPAGLLAAPPALGKPERMIRMLWTRWPARICERVVEKLLNVVNDTLREVDWIISEYSDPSDRFFDNRLLIAPDRFDEIIDKEPKHTVCVSLGNRLFPTPPGDIARRAVLDAVLNHDVAPAEYLMAQDTDAAQCLERQQIAALGTGTGSVTLPHVWFS
jgi:hypothetical protein